jgi:hypothetical protein
MADYTQEIVRRWSETGADTDGGGVTVTHPSVTSQAHTVTSCQCSGDAAALVTIESPAATILWRKRYSAAFVMSEIFPPGTVVGALSQAILIKVSAGTTNSEANFQGFSVLAG